jgi:hypothetical protein
MMFEITSSFMVVSCWALKQILQLLSYNFYIISVVYMGWCNNDK